LVTLLERPRLAFEAGRPLASAATWVSENLGNPVLAGAAISPSRHDVFAGIFSRAATRLRYLSLRSRRAGF